MNSVQWIEEITPVGLGADKPAAYAALETLPSGLPWGWIIGGSVAVVIAVVAYRVWT